MAFINEFVPQDEIEKYRLDELWNSFNFPDREMPELRLEYGYKYYWTIDREQDCWLITFGPIYSVDPKWSQSGKPEPTPERIFIFYWHGKFIDIRLSRGSESSKNIYDSPPFKRVWELISFIPEHLKKPVLPILKEALTVFGDDGIKWQVPNTVVEFKF